MIRFLMSPFRAGIREIKKDNYFRKTLQGKILKSKVSSFIAMSCMFIFIISVMYLAISYLVIVSIFLDPRIFFVLLGELLFTWVFIAIYTKVFPKTKKNYLKSKKLYKEYEEITKHI